MAMLLAVVAALVWFAPIMIVRSSLRQSFLSSATASFDGTVQVGDISASWLSPVVASDVAAWDAQGEALLTASSIRTEKSLLALLLDTSDSGILRIERPQIQLVWSQQSSNVEQAVASLFRDSSSASFAGRIEIVDGLVLAEDRLTGRRWTVSNIHAAVTVPADTAGEVEASFQGQIGDQPGAPGELAGQFSWRPGSFEDARMPGEGRIELVADGTPLEVLEPLLRRSAPRAFVGGRLSGSVVAGWSAGGEHVRIRDGRVDNLLVVAPGWIGDDRVSLPTVEASLDASRKDGQWQVRELTLASEVCSLRAVGAGPLTAVTERGGLNWLDQVWRHGGYQLATNIDVARLARLLPQTLHIRPSTQITAGRLAASVVSEPGATGRWDLQVTGADLAGTHAGRNLRLAQPIEAKMTARMVEGGWQLDDVSCSASFFNLQGQGTMLDGTASARCDLDQLTNELQQFVDLGDLQLAGNLQAQVGWRRASAGEVAIEGTATADQFVLATGDQPPWREERMQVAFAAVGLAESRQLHSLKQGHVTLESGKDRWQAELAGPVEPISLSAAVPLQTRLQGELQTWLPRLARFVGPPAGWQFDGAIQATAELTASAVRTEVTDATVEVRGFRARGPAIVVNEPVVKMTAAGVWDAAASELAAERLTLASSSLSLQAVGLRVQTGAPGLRASGDIGYRADLQRLATAVQSTAAPTAYRLGGQASGDIRLAHQADGTSVVGTSEVQDFVCETRDAAPTGAGSARPVAASESWTPLWTESLLKLAANGQYAAAADRVRLEQIEVAGGAISIAAQGDITHLAGPCVVSLDGQIAYDLQAVTARLRPQLGDQVQLSGRETRPFSFRGPLLADPQRSVPDPRSASQSPGHDARADSTLVAMTGTAALGWEAANVMGFAIGPGQFDARMADGIVNIEPLDIPLSQGRLRLVPRVVLDHAPPVLQLAKSQVADRVRITPAMCHSWLKYIAPLVADAAAAEGEFSVDLDGATVPLEAPQSSRADGLFHVHTVRVGPGPLARSLLLLAEQLRAISQQRVWNPNAASGVTWLEIPPQQVAFQMADGRVHHRGLEMHVDDIVIRTNGYVDVDQRIAMQAEVPIRDEWIAKNQYLAGLQGRTLQVPISGTLSQPRLDQRGLENLTRQAVGGAINQALEGQINRGLEKLFGPPRN